jgi:PhzF family phenazine biosynthesis protein
MEILNFATLDVFTSTAYEGNPLALIRIPASLRHIFTQEKKQLIAREFNLSETVFLHENTQNEPHNEWTIDIFTTTAELPFAGHPTIGAACYVLNGFAPDAGVKQGTFVTRAGRIPIAISGGFGKEMMGTWGSVQADIPHDVHIHRHTLGDLKNPIPGLSSKVVLAQAEKAAPIVSIVKGMTFLLVRLESLEELAEVEVVGEVSFHGLLDQGDGWDQSFVARYYYVVEGERIANGGVNGSGDEVRRVRTRMIEDTMEDPATGSAACALSSFLALQEGRTRKFEVTQGVEMGRRSVIGVEVVIDREGNSVQSVRLSGVAVQVMEGSLRT